MLSVLPVGAGLRLLVGGLDLSQDLGLAQYPGVESGRHAEKMEGRFLRAPGIKVGAEVRRGAADDPVGDGLRRALALRARRSRGVDLEAAAGGEDQDLGDRTFPPQGLQGGGKHGYGHR